MGLSPGQRTLLVALWLAVLVACALYSGLRILSGGAFESNILGLIPAAEDSAGLTSPQLATDSEIQKHFVILVSHPRADRGQALALALREQLAGQAGIDVHQETANPLAALAAFYRPYRHQLLTPQLRRDLENKAPVDLARQVFNELHSPLRPVRPFTLAEDPFNLGGAWLQGLFPATAELTPGIVPALRDGADTWHLVRGKLVASPFALASQEGVIGAVAGLRTREPDAEVLVSGLVFHAAEVATTARREISTVGLGSLLGILLLVVAVFRSAAPLLAIVFTLSGSVLVALTASLALFGTVHLITLAFGSTLLGLAVDYCFHFLIKCRRHRQAGVAGRLLLKGLVLSAGSSILAYLIQLLSPLPGLQQIAVFVIFGLLGSCASVAVLALCYREPGADRSRAENPLFTRYFAPAYAGLARRKLLLLGCAAVAGPVLVMLLVRAGFSDDIRLLNTSSAQLLGNEQRVRHLLGGIDTQRYWLVAGEDIQHSLARSEAVIASLPAGLQVMAAARLTPSLARQQQDQQLIATKLYGPQGALAELCGLLDSDCAPWRDLTSAFQPGLTPAAIPPAVAELFPVLALGSDRRQLLLPYLGAALNTDRLTALALPEGARFVDQVANLSATLAAFRVEVSSLFGVFLLLFALVFLWLYRTRVILVLTCVLVSLLAALALSAGGGITLFHILALLLVMGIAVDTVVFYLELGLDGDTWLASTLSMLTSILAFGLLSLSQVPLLHYFGSVVFFGLLSAWLVTPVLYLMANAAAERAGAKGSSL